MSWAARWLLYFHDWNNNVNEIIKTTTTQKLNALTSPTTDNGPKFKPLRIGILGAAEINYVSIIEPVSTHPTALITAIAARSKSRAEAQIAYYKDSLPGEVKAYGSYEQVIDDPEIDAIYIPLPNGLHYRWTLAALDAGKHVLVEKPVTSNAREAREVTAAARRNDKVVLEAFHWLFHPAAHTVKAMLTGGEYGRVLSVKPSMILPAGILGPDDIRFKYSLGGGSSMDLTYVYSASCYFADQTSTFQSFAESATSSTTSPTGGSTVVRRGGGGGDGGDEDKGFRVLEAKPRINPTDPLIDDAMTAVISFDGPGDNTNETKAITSCDLYLPKLFGIVPRIWFPPPGVQIECERAEIEFSNFAGPWLKHEIIVTPLTRDSSTGNILKRGKKGKPQTCYVGGPEWEREERNDKSQGKGVIGEEWWTTYRYQLEGFVRKIQEVEEENRNKTDDDDDKRYTYKGPWVSMEQSVRIMDVIDQVYKKAGLPVRGE